MSADEAIKAAMVIKEYCKAQKDCVDCVFFKDYPEIMEECELNRYVPLTWQLRRGQNYETESQADNTGD